MGEESVRIGMLGFGNVGTAVARLLHQDGDRLRGVAGRPLVLRRALVKDATKPREVPAGAEIASDPAAVLEAADIDLVIEAMGGIEPATSYLLRALQAGKPVVTANKEAIAYRGKELLEAASAAGVPLRFEASVAGGVPIIRALKRSLVGDSVLEIAGIVNGTVNYVLGLMESGCEREQAVRLAQERGYAEPDPSKDLNGYDAACKLAILASIAFGCRVVPDQVWTEGITNITREDLLWGRELGYVLKLLAVARSTSRGIEVYVRPTFLPQEHPLAGVRGVTNAVLVRGRWCGELVFQGAGAGGEPTATAIMADVLEIVRQLAAGGEEGTYCTCREEAQVVPAEKSEGAAYLHLEVVDRPGVLAQVARCLAAHGVSAAEVLQKARGREAVPLLFITHPGPLGALRAALDDIAGLAVVRQVRSVIAVVGKA